MNRALALACLVSLSCGRSEPWPGGDRVAITVLKAAGLHTADNQLTLPPGAMLRADNVVIRNRDTVEPRRGFDYTTTGTFGSGGSLMDVFAFFGSAGRVGHYDTTKLAYNTGSSWSSISGSYSAVDATLLRMKFVEAGQNLYFNTSAGIERMESITGAPVLAGVPAPLNAMLPSAHSFLYGNPGGAGSWFSQNGEVSYRRTLCYKDSHGAIHESTPTGRLVVTNPADVVVGVGSLALNGSGLATATVTSHGFGVGDKLTLSPGEANFPAATYTITAVTSTTFAFALGGAVNVSTLAQTFSSGLKQVSMIFYLPRGLTTSHFYRVYRTPASVTAPVDPGDEHYLVYEAFLKAADIANQYASYTDLTPESMLGLGSPLYTNPQTGNGILVGNIEPPIAKDVAQFQERLWFANTTERHRYTLQMLGTGTPNGVQDGDVIDISGFAFNAKTSPSNTGDFQVFTTFDPAKNIQLTTEALAVSINATNLLNSGTWVRASASSNSNEPPGKLLLESVTLGGSPLYFAVSRPASWSPVAPTHVTVTSASTSRTSNVVTVTTGTAHGFTTGQNVMLAVGPFATDANFPAGVKSVASTPTGSTFTYAEAGSNATMSGGAVYYAHDTSQASDNGAAVNKLFYSKFQEPEAVPLLNNLYVGAKNKQILRIIPLRDKLYVFKEDGIYLVSGQDPFFTVDLLDKTTWLIAPDTALVVNNQIYALTNQGVVTVSESGIGIISRPIENLLIPKIANANTRLYSFATGYESDRLYILGLASIFPYAHEQYVYGTLSNAWTRWLLPAQFALVDPVADKLNVTFGFGLSVGGIMGVERKAFTYADGYDLLRGDTCSLTAGPANAQGYVGATVQAGSGLIIGSDFFLVTWADAGLGELTFVGTGAMPVYAKDAPGTAQVATFIPAAIEWAPVVPEPNVSKQFRELVLHFQGANVYAGLATTRTEQHTSVVTTAVQVGYTAGATPTEFLNRRVLVPLENQRAVLLRPGFKTNEAGAVWKLSGFTVELDGVSQRSSRN